MSTREPTKTLARPARQARRRFVGAILAASWAACTGFAEDRRRVVAYVDIDTPGARDAYRRFQQALESSGTRARLDVDVRFIALDQTDAKAIGELPGRLAALSPWLVIATSLPTARVVHAMQRPALFYAPMDPVVLGLVASVSRPGGLMTGYAGHPPSLEKMLELAAEAFPDRRRVAVVTDRLFAAHSSPQEALARAGQRLGRTATVVLADTREEFDAFFADGEARRHDALVIPYTAVPFRHSRHVVDAVAKAGLPALFGSARLVREGGLLGVEADISDVAEVFARQVAAMADGFAPGDIPVERPKRFPVFLNMATARSLGVKLQPGFLKRVEVIVE